MSKNLRRSVIILGTCDYEESTIKFVLLAPAAMTPKRADPHRLAHEFASKKGNPDDNTAFAAWLESKGFERLNFGEWYFDEAHARYIRSLGT